jgi:hypothetical protein
MNLRVPHPFAFFAKGGAPGVQEIRVSRSFFARRGIPLHSDWYPSRFKRGDQRSPPTSREKRARYGAPEFVARKTRDACYGDG